jgi:transposase, IS5 family
MIVDRYDPINLFEMVPKLKLQFEPELAHLDELLDDDELFDLVKADLVKRYPNSGRLGRHSTPAEVILRMLVVKRLYAWSYEPTANASSPTRSAVCFRRAKKLLPTEEIDRLGKEIFRTRNRSLRRVARRLHRIARRKGDKAKADLKEAYQKLISITRTSCAQANEVVEVLRKSAEGGDREGFGPLLKSFERFMPLVERRIDQATRRVLKAEYLPATEKVLSLFEEHTQIITRHKAGKPREFGRKILIDEVDRGIISRYEVLAQSGSERVPSFRESEGASATFRASAFPLGWRPGSLFGRERENRPAGGCEACSPAQER